MDTAIKQIHLPLEALFNFAIIGVLIFSQNVFANNIRMANLSVPAELLETKQRIEIFEENITQKYPKALINDICAGVRHIRLTKYYNGKPVRINIVEADLMLADLRLAPALASERSLHSRRQISAIAANNNAVAAINGTFFKPETGLPLGTLMIDGKIYTGPVYDRVALGIFGAGNFDMARVQLDAVLRAGDEAIKVDNINQPRMSAPYVLVYTPEWGKTAPMPPKSGKAIAVSGGMVSAVSKINSALPMQIPEDGYVIVGPSEKLDKITGSVELDVTTIPGWENVEHIISGGPYLVRNGEVFTDVKEQKLTAIDGRNPRSAIGYTNEGNLILVTVDGREESSAGMTLTELAEFMKQAGAVNAMNLDGGGSTVMYANGRIVNRPQQAGGIPLSNAIVLMR